MGHTFSAAPGGFWQHVDYTIDLFGWVSQDEMIRRLTRSASVCEPHQRPGAAGFPCLSSRILIYENGICRLRRLFLFPLDLRLCFFHLTT